MKIGADGTRHSIRPHTLELATIPENPLHALWHEIILSLLQTILQQFFSGDTV